MMWTFGMPFFHFEAEEFGTVDSYATCTSKLGKALGGGKQHVSLLERITRILHLFVEFLRSDLIVLQYHIRVFLKLMHVLVVKSFRFCDRGVVFWTGTKVLWQVAVLPDDA
jgi:hypothetical protein